MSTSKEFLNRGKSGNGLKIMIQVDFEGVTNVVNWDEIYPDTLILTEIAIFLPVR